MEQVSRQEKPDLRGVMEILVGASLLAKASAHSTSLQTDPLLSRASSLPQWIFSRHKIHVYRKTCGSEPAREGVSTFNITAN
jgi:hypothetical protein